MLVINYVANVQHVFRSTTIKTKKFAFILQIKKRGSKQLSLEPLYNILYDHVIALELFIKANLAHSFSNSSFLVRRFTLLKEV